MSGVEPGPALTGSAGAAANHGHALDRAGRLDDYYDWPAMRSARRADKVLCGMAGATDAIFVPLVLLSPPVGLTMWSAARGLASGAYRVLGRALGRQERMRLRMLRDRDGAVSCTAADLDRLPRGTAVRMRGRAHVRRALPSMLEPGQPGGGAAVCWVLVREELLPERAFFVERGHDFDLMDTDGATVRIVVGNARLAGAQRPGLQPVPDVVAARLCQAVPEALIKKRPLDPQHVRAAELMVSEGAEVEVHGFSARVVDPTVPALPRDMPLRPALVGEPERPLLIMLA